MEAMLGTSKFGQCYRFDAFLSNSNEYSFARGQGASEASKAVRVVRTRLAKLASGISDGFNGQLG
jgi:hypothetical protein